MRPDSPEQDNDRPSKTQLKKQSHELQELGQALAEMSAERLNALLDEGAIDESLRDALREYQRTRSHEGRRRQLQYIGKLMRHADPQPLREAVAALQVPRARDTLALHEAERWREELAADDNALTRWLERHPQTDTQRLRALIRSARKEAALPPEQRHGRAWRELFQFIKSEEANHG
jgi:ribosome-associated protein